jgi:uncharacterized protein (AIM24 family)
MKHEILYKGAFPMLRVQLEAGENIKAEAGAMVSMSPNIELKGTVDGGIMRDLAACSAERSSSSKN